MVTPLSAPAAAFAHELMRPRPLAEAAQVEGLDLATALAALLTAGAFAAAAPDAGSEPVAGVS